ncbi:tudor domain-containing protein 5-like [Hippocampus comes]|uniref:tudor domain-containing protein 5-like n=1 Tax=Hippocampus comes TaxID=109280 RepID=UPI00094EFF77|nr:PREDICTED: tudor domain-containing protein 5-like [Hippocampus comes]
MLEAVADLIFIQPTNMGFIVTLRNNVVSMHPAGLFYTTNCVKKMSPKSSQRCRIPTQGKPSESPTCLPTAARNKNRDVEADVDQKLLLERPSGKAVHLIENGHVPIQPLEGDKDRTVVGDWDSPGRGKLAKPLASNMLGYPMPLQLLGFSNVMDMAAAMPDVLSVTRGVNGCPVLKAVSDKSTMHIEQLVANQRRPKKKSTGDFHQYQPAPILPRQTFFLSLDTFRAQLQILLYQGPLKLCDLNSCYVRCFGHKLIPDNFGFNTLREMLEAVADLIFIQPTNMGFIVTLRNNVVSMHPAGLFYTTNCVKKMSPKSSQRCRIPTQGKPSESPTCLPTAARNKNRDVEADVDQKLLLERPSGKAVHLIENGHVPIQPLEGDKDRTVVGDWDSPGRVDSSQEGSIGHSGTNAHKKSLSPQEGKIMTEDNRCSTEAQHDGTSEESAEERPAIKVCRNSAVAQDETLDVLLHERLKRPTQRAAREITAVQVEHVESPGHFYISFFESDESRALLNMMFEMRQFYTCPEVSERYQLPRRFVRRGQACCVATAGLWFYRVVIQRVVSTCQVEVYFVDYGNTTTLPSANLKFLKTCFSILPAQAVPSSLAGIKPRTGAWTSEATASFQSLCSNHVLVGAFKCYAGDVLQLYLCDTHTSDDVYIHAVLLSQGHAVACWPSPCVKDSPVTLYLGDDKIDPDEVEEMTLDDVKGATITEKQVELDEMPGLELIVEEEVFALLSSSGEGLTAGFLQPDN